VAPVWGFTVAQPSCRLPVGWVMQVGSGLGLMIEMIVVIITVIIMMIMI
jgi:hypothetical protein